MANTQDEPEITYSDGSVDILSQPDDRFTFKKLINPPNTEPSSLSGLIVNICTSILGETYKTGWNSQNYSSDYRSSTSSGVISCLFFIFFPPLGVLVCVFSVVASQGGYAYWSLTALGVIVVVCLILIIIIWRQPQSKTNLAFKVSVCPFTKGFFHAISYPYSSVSLSLLEINSQ